MDDETLKYLFDLNGYVVIENVLSTGEVAALNSLLDRQPLPPPEERLKFGRAPDGAGFLEWGAPFCQLLTHPRVMPILRLRLGDCFLLDRIYGIHMNPGMPSRPLHADFGASANHTPNGPGEYYSFPELEIAEGYAVVSWALSDLGPDVGGFCCVPGSHKSHYRVPREIAEAREDAPCVVVPPAPAGSAIVFTESLTHGTTAWRGPCQRRSLFYKYCISHLAWRPRHVQEPATQELTCQQKILFHNPGHPHRFFPSLFEDEAP